MKKNLANKFPRFLKYYYLLRLALETKHFPPNRSELSYSKELLYADPHDPRGNSLLRNKGTGQASIKYFWRKALEIYNPSVVIDIGANYGEVLLDAHYPDSVKHIVGIEANPYVSKYLERSVAAHTKANRISIYNNLAGNDDTATTTFYIDKKSSGRSTALKSNFVREPIEIKVQSLRVDKLVMNLSKDGPIIFKVDVEGFEPFVLQGMTKLSKNGRDMVGCIEFNLASLEKNDINVEDYLSFLEQFFTLAALQKDGSAKHIERLSIKNLKKHFNNKYTEGDLLLFGSQRLAELY